jgi:hypothetical protein
MAIPRTADVDDDGSLTTGTIRNNAWKTALYDQIDARWSEATTTATGTQNNLSISEGDTFRANNATALTITGLVAPASPAKPGKPLRVVAIGAGTVTLNNEDAGSTAANRIITGTGAALTLAAATGWALVVYDGTSSRWRVLASSVATGGGQIAFSSGASVQAQNTTAYYGTGGPNTNDERQAEIVLAAAITITKLYAYCSIAPANGQTATFTLRKNEADTSVTCVITGTGAATLSANDTAHSVAFSAGDRMSIKVVTSATTGNIQAMATVAP